MSYDLHFDKETKKGKLTNRKGMSLTFGEAKGYLIVWNGMGRRLFEPFIGGGGIVSIVCNETGISRYMEYVR